MPADLRVSNRSWEALLTAHAVLMRRFQAEAIWHDHHLTMREYDVLYTLSKCPNGEAGMREVRENVLLSQPALSRMVDRLVTRGLVGRRTDDNDGRAVRLSLTEQGAELQRTLGRAHARSVDREMRVLSREERLELERIARKLAG